MTESKNGVSPLAILTWVDLLWLARQKASALLRLTPLSISPFDGAIKTCKYKYHFEIIAADK